MDEKIIYENEMETPADWESNTILIRDSKGNIIEQEIPDDVEEGE